MVFKSIQMDFNDWIDELRDNFDMSDLYSFRDFCRRIYNRALKDAEVAVEEQVNLGCVLFGEVVKAIRSVTEEAPE